MPRKKKITLQTRKWVLEDGTAITIEGPATNHIAATNRSISVSMDKPSRVSTFSTPFLPDAFIADDLVGPPRPEPQGQVFMRDMNVGRANSPEEAAALIDAKKRDAAERRRRDAQSAELEGVGLDENALIGLAGTGA